MSTKIDSLFFDPLGTYLACDASGRKVPEECLDVPAWIVAVVKEKMDRGVVGPGTTVHIPYGQKMTVSEILRRAP